MNDINKLPITDVFYTAQISEQLDSKLSLEAQTSAAKVNKKPGRHATVFREKAELTEFLRSPASRTLRKLHFIGHGALSLSGGTSVKLGDETREDLVAYANQHLTDKPDLQKITLHSCHSGASGRNGAPSMAEHLANHLDPPLHGVKVGGYHGFAVQQNDGGNFAISAERPKNWRWEAEWNRQHQQPRPVFVAGDAARNLETRQTALEQASKRADRDSWMHPASAPASPAPPARRQFQSITPMVRHQHSQSAPAGLESVAFSMSGLNVSPPEETEG